MTTPNPKCTEKVEPPLDRCPFIREVYDGWERSIYTCEKCGYTYTIFESDLT